tara:strand:- start:2360 stop:3592 length:1233 start_codon:yes stop_codon:yes gene_type:complete
MFNAYYHKKIRAYLKILLLSVIYISIFISKSHAENQNEVKVGILLGFTGVVESLTPSMADSAELAFNEISNDEELSKQIKFKIQRSDTSCSNKNLAKDSATKLIKEGISAIIGAACPDITMEVAKNVSVPKKILMISPADTSNELINLKDDGYVFRTTPPKLRGSKILADITKDRGIRSVAITYSAEEDYQKFAKAYSDNLMKNNIKTSVMIPHNKNINDYSKHISALTAAGGDALAIISDIDLGGDQIINSILDTGMFNVLVLSHKMVDQKIIDKFKEENLKKSFGYLHGLSNIGAEKFLGLAKNSGIDPSNPYTGESYDAAAIIILSNFAKIFSKDNSIKNNIYSVANKPGIKIFPGEIKKAINILSKGKSINYEGATGVEFDEFGDTFGSFVEIDFKKGKLKSKKLR